MKLATKAEVLKWWNESPDNWKAAAFIEQYCGSGQRGLYLKVNSTPKPKLIFRLRKSILKCFELKELNSDFINVKYFQIHKIKP